MIEDLVPPGHCYRHLDSSLDLSFIRDLVRDCYAATGRPSIDPIMFFKSNSCSSFQAIVEHYGTVL